MMQWIKELVSFLLFSGIFLMLIPDTDLRQFVKLVVGLILIALMIQPLAGTGILLGSNELTARLKESWHAAGEARIDSAETDYLRVQAERLVEKGSGVMREQMESQTNRQLGALLGLFAGVDEAQVVTQVNAQGQLERVVVQLHLTKDASDGSELPYTSETGGDGALVPLVQPVLVAEHSSVSDPPRDPLREPLVKRVRTWVAGFYGIDPDCVMVTTL